MLLKHWLTLKGWYSDLQADLGVLLYDLATYLFPSVWFGLVCQYYFLVTNEPVIDVSFYFCPFYLSFASLFLWAPPSFTLNWVSLCLSCDMALFPVDEGRLVDFLQMV